jgi:hypothetical protein
MEKESIMKLDYLITQSTILQYNLKKTKLKEISMLSFYLT